MKFYFRILAAVVVFFTLVEMSSFGFWLLNQASDLAVLAGMLVLVTVPVAFSVALLRLFYWRKE